MQSKSQNPEAELVKGGEQEEEKYTLAAYGQGVPLSTLASDPVPPMKTQADRDAFEADQARGWIEDRS
jgi:hypothetical protein